MLTTNANVLQERKTRTIAISIIDVWRSLRSACLSDSSGAVLCLLCNRFDRRIAKRTCKIFFRSRITLQYHSLQRKELFKLTLYHFINDHFNFFLFIYDSWKHIMDRPCLSDRLSASLLSSAVRPILNTAEENKHECWFFDLRDPTGFRRINFFFFFAWKITSEWWKYCMPTIKPIYSSVLRHS